MLVSMLALSIGDVFGQQAASVTLTVTTSDPTMGFVAKGGLRDTDLAPTSGASYDIVVPRGTDVTLEAWPYEGSAFLQWTGDIPAPQDGWLDNHNLKHIRVNEDMTVCANFSKAVVLKVPREALGSGVVTEDDPTTRAYAPGGRAVEIESEREGYAFWGTFASGSKVLVVAQRGNGVTFKRWLDADGKVVCEDEDYTFTISGDTELHAEYFKSFNVDLTIFGGGEVKVGGWRSPVLHDAVVPAPQNEPLVLEALPDEDYRFVHWMVDGKEASNPRLEVNVTKNMNVDAIFESEWVGNGEYYVLTLIPDGFEGILWIDEGKEFIHVPTARIFKAGTEVTVVAAPAEGYEFIRWRGNFSGVQPFKRIKMNGDWIIGADFEKMGQLKNDSDKDNLPDDWEVQHHLNPAMNDAKGDPDGDGVTNFYEFWCKTDPQVSDSDHDSLPDGWEIENGLDPNSGTGKAGPDGDPDFDGRTNKVELKDKTRADLFDRP